MEDTESLDCMVCSRLAQYAVLTPCCSSLACRICAVTNIVKSQGKCCLCHSSPVLLSSLVPHHHVRKKAEEIEVWNQVTERESEENVEKKKSMKRTLDDSSKNNNIESKRMKLDKSNHSDLKVNESNNTDSPHKVLQTEIQAIQTKNETIGGEISKRTNSDFDKEKCEPKSALEASVAKHCQHFNGDKQDAAQSGSGQGAANMVMKELKNANETLTVKENELEQLKKIIKCKNEELIKIKLSLAEEEVKKNMEEKVDLLGKLSLAEEEIKRMLIKNKALNDNTESLKEEKKKLEEENLQLKSANQGDNIGTNDIVKGRTSDADMTRSNAELEAVISKSASEINEIMTANKALKKKMDEKEERYRKVLVKAKAKIQTVELQNSELHKKLIQNQAVDDSKTTKMAENEERTIQVSTNAVVKLDNRDLRGKMADSDLHSQFGQSEEIYQRKVAFASSINSRKQDNEKEEDREDNSKTDQHEEIMKTGSKDDTAVEDAEFNDYNYWKIDTFNQFSVKPFLDISSKPTLDENRIQGADSTSKWRIIFMDCEKISDGDHTQFTQIGCYVYRVSNRRKSSFFLPMYPTKLKAYLQMKQKSDLLKTLNLTWEKEFGFQFVEPDGVKVKALSESEGFEDFLIFLGVTLEGEDNVLFINSAQCILPLLFNKISLDLLQKYIAGICDLNTFLSKSLDDNHLADVSHTDDIYQRVMRKSFEEITPTCSQTAKYMFKIVEKICEDQGNHSLNFESFISKYFEPTSYFIEKFAHLSTSGNENLSGDTVSLEIETSFRPGFPVTVEMYQVDMVDLTGLSEFLKNSKKEPFNQPSNTPYFSGDFLDTFMTSESPKNKQKHALNPPKRVLTVGNYELKPVKGKTVVIMVEFEGIYKGVKVVSLKPPIPPQHYRFLTMERWAKEGAKKVFNKPSIKLVEGKYGFLEIGLTKKKAQEIKSIKTAQTHKIPAGTHILNYAKKSKGSLPSSYDADLDMFIKCNKKNLHNISNCVDENMSALLMRSSRFPAPVGKLPPKVTLPAPTGKLPPNVTLPVPVPARKPIVHKITEMSEATLIKMDETSIVHKITEMSQSTLRKTEETSKMSPQTTQTNHPTKPSYRNNTLDQSCSKDSTEPCSRHNFWDQYCKSCTKNRPEQLCIRNPKEESCSKNPAKKSSDKNCTEQPCMEDPSNLNPIPLALRCSLCAYMLEDAVILPCCMASTCDACARDMLLRDDFTCKLCMGKRLRLDLLIPSVKLRRDVFEFRQLKYGGPCDKK